MSCHIHGQIKITEKTVLICQILTVILESYKMILTYDVMFLDEITTLLLSFSKI